MRRLRFLAVCMALAATAPATQAAGVRDFTRMAPATTVTEAQASELTLTLTDVATRTIQNWIRTAGTLDKTGRILTTFVQQPECDLVRMGQRVQTYTVNSRTKMTLGYVTRIAREKGGARIEVTLSAPVAERIDRLMEIVVERGPFLSVPNVAIIEEGEQQVVYLAGKAGQYAPRTIKTGIQGELYTQVTEGLTEGDQVVSIGSFFVDADTKLKSASMAAMPGMDMSMPGMDMAAMPGMNHAATAEAAANVSPAAGAEPVMTEPAADAVVKAPLAMIHVLFAQPIDVASAGFAVTKDGLPVDVGQPMPMGSEGKMLMAMPKTPLSAGQYAVRWHAVNAAGQPLQGEFSFTVQ